MNTFLPMATRAAARKTNSNMKSSGKNSAIVDKGNHLKGIERWGVMVHVVTAAGKKVKKTKVERKDKNVGFDLRPATATNSYDLYLNGEFILRRVTKLEAYEAGVELAIKTKMDYTSLNYK